MPRKLHSLAHVVSSIMNDESPLKKVSKTDKGTIISDATAGFFDQICFFQMKLVACFFQKDTFWFFSAVTPVLVFCTRSGLFHNVVFLAICFFVYSEGKI